MPYPEKLVKSWRACWYVPWKKTPEKKSGFPTRKAALDYARRQEIEASDQARAGLQPSDMLFEEWVNQWYAALDLEPNTMAAYQVTLENHLLPRWGDYKLTDLANAALQVDEWITGLTRAGYSDSSITSYRRLLYTLCADAIEAGHMVRNPAAKRRTRGRVAVRRKRYQAERDKRTATDPFTALLIAERCAILTGRDDDFIMVVTAFYTGARWGELIGLLISAVHPRLQIHHQLSRGNLWKEPKDGSVRDLDVPPFLARLLARQAAQVKHPAPPSGARWCPCAEGKPDKYRHRPGIHLFSGPRSWHWANNHFGPYIFDAATRGVTKPGTPQERPIRVARPAEGELGPLDVTRPFDPRRHEAVACWASLVPGMTMHGMRHSHKTWLEDLSVPAPLMNERMGHVDHSVQARYGHVTEGMRERLKAGLEQMWEEALEQRRALWPASSVGVVSELLERGSATLDSRSTPDRVLRPVRLQRADTA